MHLKWAQLTVLCIVSTDLNMVWRRILIGLQFPLVMILNQSILSDFVDVAVADSAPKKEGYIALKIKAM